MRQFDTCPWILLGVVILTGSLAFTPPPPPAPAPAPGSFPRATAPAGNPGSDTESGPGSNPDSTPGINPGINPGIDPGIDPTGDPENTRADAPTPNTARQAVLGRPLTDREMAHHVLCRMAFGPRPGQIDAVAAEGWETWVRRQLRPDTLDDTAPDRIQTRRWPSLAMTMAETFAAYRPAYEHDPPTMADQRQRNQLRAKVRRELRESVLVRAVTANAQFREVICEFWRNHFSIDQSKDEVGYLANHYEQQVIRAHAFGRFEDMLLASAQHPAMLIYLDNIVSQKPLTDREARLVERFESRAYKPRSVEALGRQRGLNENYARELMELHTLGVDNGYTQHDVTELARALTGWTARWDRDKTYGFAFRREVHDNDAKHILGVTVRRGGGADEGIQVIARLARDPRTARFISRKLCRYLVHDQPTDALVNRTATVFLKTDGHLPSVYEAILLSDEFASTRSYQAKFRTPFEFVVASLRATDVTMDTSQSTLGALARMGQPIYQQPDPTGYADQAEAWLDPGVLIYRWTFALALAHDRLDGVRIPANFLERFAHQPPQTRRDALIRELIPAGVDDATKQTLLDAFTRNPDPRNDLALILGSPPFQQQ